MRILVFDGYVDEPACLGVPPYLSPHARYVNGVAKELGHDCDYITIDEWRQRSPRRELIDKADLMVMVSGAMVPGKYLRATPMSYREATDVASHFRGDVILAGASALYGFGRGGGKETVGKEVLKSVFTHVARLDADALLYDLLDSGHATQRRRTHEEWRRWSILGAPIARQAPDYPNPLIAEIDTYKGCVRYISGGCSFCMEPKEGKPLFRPIIDVIDECGALHDAGVVNLRIGGQACFFSYHSEGVGKTQTPKLNPGAIRELLAGIRERCPRLQVLCIDNVDPAIMAAHPKEAFEIAKVVGEYCTAGNIAAFGLETADPAVKEANNLNASVEEVMTAIRILNEASGERGANGMPKFLPGINFLAGLAGETPKTFELNLGFLKSLMKDGLVVRRINIRKVLTFTGEADTHDREYHAFKARVRDEIDHEMLKRVVPVGTVLKDVFMEVRDGGYTFGRQIGTYPLLVGLEYPVELNRFTDILVTDHGQRSITGISIPVAVNKASIRELSALPGVGKKRATRLVVKRPFGSLQEMYSALDEPEALRPVERYLSLD
ncbi:MAG: radical SAM protein [Euryarchaeota archaeon]|nr:radical SAM protein [Euryarchaeota archaeon]